MITSSSSSNKIEYEKLYDVILHGDLGFWEQDSDRAIGAAAHLANASKVAEQKLARALQTDRSASMGPSMTALEILDAIEDACEDADKYGQGIISEEAWRSIVRGSLYRTTSFQNLS